MEGSFEDGSGHGKTPAGLKCGHFVRFVKFNLFQFKGVILGQVPRCKFAVLKRSLG